MFVNSQNLRHLDQGDHRSGHGRPQTHDKEKPSCGEWRGAEGEG